MEWTRALDGYCERMDPSFWAEPLNAVSNAAFMIAAIIMWMRAAQPICRVLSVLLFAIGVGSFLFHTTAQVWSAIADVAAIAVFVVVFVWATHRYIIGLLAFWSAVAVVGFLGFVFVAVYGFQAMPFFSISAGYWPIALAIFAYGVWFLRSDVSVGWGFIIGSAILSVSLVLRSVDMPFCDRIPMGTHLWWHVLNGVMLGWMIEVLRRHLAGGVTGR